VLTRELAERGASRRPLRVGLVGAGAFGTMFLAQARRLAGLHVLGVCDLDPGRARSALVRAGFPPAQLDARDAAHALRAGTTWATDDVHALAASGIDVMVEATGSPRAAIVHAGLAVAHGVHCVNVTVEADALVGPLLAERAAAAGLAHGYAYGDQPALVCELVDWARTCGFEVVSAGKGTKYLPAYHASTPERVWDSYGIDAAHAARAGLNPQLFNSFLDGTKSAIEMAAVADATGLAPPAGGLGFPPCGTERLAAVCVPEDAGGVLERAGTVEVVSSLERDGTTVANDLRWGVYVVFEAPSPFVAERFREYGLRTDPSGRYAALWRPSHLVGLELSVSVLRAGLRGEATGTPTAFVGDVVSVAKRDLATGEVLDGEGGATVWGRLVPVAHSLAGGALPVGASQAARMRRPVRAGAVVRWEDVDVDGADPAVRLRHELEARERPVR
jgi:predicted homoserine dehydrogenase-like protein